MRAAFSKSFPLKLHSTSGMAQQADFVFKLLLIGWCSPSFPELTCTGDSGVGKTALMHRFADDDADISNLMMTIGISRLAA